MFMRIFIQHQMPAITAYERLVIKGQAKYNEEGFMSNVFISPLFDKYYQKHPIKLIDIGASGGLQQNWKGAKKHLEYIGFEPDKRSFRELKNNAPKGEIYINKALHKDKGSVDFYLTKQKTASSIYLPNKSFIEQFPEAERFEISQISKMDVESLDSQLECHNISGADFIKLDSQGSELLILEGAKRTLDDVFGLEIEVEFNQIYEKQPLFSDMDKFLRNSGFQLFDLKPYYWKRKIGKEYGGLKGQIVFADALYFRSPDQLQKKFSNIKDEVLLKSKILHSISIAILYGYIDYALEVFEKQKSVFTEEESRTLLTRLKRSKCFSAMIPWFPGRGKVAKLFKKLYNTFRYTYKGWVVTEEFLGNLD